MSKKEVILKLYDELLNEIILADDRTKQAILWKNKSALIEKINDISKQYDEFIDEIQH
jgi:hypothetical protein